MREKSIAIGILRIAYVENNPDANKTIFFIHGNSCSSRMWQKQLQSVLFSSYRMIAFDLPGHGKSFVSENPDDDYSPTGTAKILSSAVALLAGTAPYILVGFSLGSNLVAEMLQYDLQPKAIVLVGSCVLGENYGLEKIFMPSDTPSIFLYNETDDKTVSGFLHQHILPVHAEDIGNCIADYLNVSPDFKPALFKTAAEGKISDEILALKKINIPVCVIFGQEDKLVNIIYLDGLPFPVWKNQIFKLPGAGHWVNIDQSEMFNQIISEFVLEVFKQHHV